MPINVVKQRFEGVDYPRRSDEQDVVITSSRFRLSEIFVFRVGYLKKRPSRRGEHIGHKWKWLEYR